MRMQDRRKKNKTVFAAADLGWHQDRARYNARGLHDCTGRIASERILALQFHGKVQALVQHARERMRRVETHRSQHGHHLAEEKIPDPRFLGFVPLGAAQKFDALRVERGNEVFVEYLVLVIDQMMRLLAHLLQALLGGHSIRADSSTADFDLFLEPGHAYLEEFVKIAADDAQVFQAFQQGDARVFSLRQHAMIELEYAKFAVQVLLRGKFLCQVTADLGFGRDVSFRRRCAFTEEIAFHLLRKIFACLRVGKVEAVLVDNHRLQPDPALPGFLRHIFENTLTQRTWVRRTIQTFRFVSQLDALNHSRHVDFRTDCGCKL